MTKPIRRPRPALRRDIIKDEETMGPKPMPSWRRNMKTGTQIEEARDPYTGKGATYFAANSNIKMGDFLGDTITQVVAANVIWEAERPDEVVLSLYKDNPLNFLWYKFIRRTNAEVIWDVNPGGDIGQRIRMLDARIRDGEVNGVVFDNYKEFYRRIDAPGRQQKLAGTTCLDKCIIEQYYYGQQKHLPMPYWSVGPHFFDVPEVEPGDYVFIAPLEKCQNNAIYTFPMWREVILSLIEDGIPVVLNERSKFCADLKDKISITFEPFEQMMAQIKAARVVACGNTGPMWAAGALGVPSVICENSDMAMPEYAASRNRMTGLRFICNEPNPAYIAARIKEVYRG